MFFIVTVVHRNKVLKSLVERLDIGQTNVVLSAVEDQYIIPHRRKTLWDVPSFLSSGYRGLFSVKEACHSPPSRHKADRPSNPIDNLIYSLMAQCSVTYKQVSTTRSECMYLSNTTI